MIETQKILLDYLVKMHDQLLTDMSRHSKNAYETKHREIHKRHKRAVDNIIDTSHSLILLPDNQPICKEEILSPNQEKILLESIQVLEIFKKLEEKGLGDLLLARYPSLRKYFADFIKLPFAVEQGSSDLMIAIKTVRQLDPGELKTIPHDAPTSFVPKELRRTLKDGNGSINRNAWEMSLAFAIKDSSRSGDLYLPKSKQHISFWDMMLNESRWRESREAVYSKLELPKPSAAKSKIVYQFNESVDQARRRFNSDDFATIKNGKLKLKREDKAYIPATVTKLQKAINVSMPFIRIEQLLMEVDKITAVPNTALTTYSSVFLQKHFRKHLTKDVRTTGEYKYA